MQRNWVLAAIGAVLILAGSLLAHAIQTSAGTTVTDVRFPAPKGVTLSGLLYVPRGVDATHPAPAVLISHGYINTREMQSPFAIELARRGFVVLAMDMTGHGYSGGNVGADDFGGPAALTYLQNRPFVDRNNIGLEGHSMGGAPVLAAAVAQPNGYRSMVLEGSTIGLFGPPAPGTATYPRNLALVFGQYDEFAGLMWQVPKGSLIAQSPRLPPLFGVGSAVEAGKTYGDVSQGTARVLFNPPVTHPWEHFSGSGIGHAVDWFQTTLSGASAPRDPRDQIWIWKEAGTLTAFVGFVVLMLGSFQLLLSTKALAPLAQPAEPVGEMRGPRWWLSLLLTAVVPAVTFFAFMKLGALFKPMAVFPQSVHNQLVVWALLNAAVTLLLGLVMRGDKPNLAKTDWPRGVGIALGTVGVGYLSLVLVDAVFKTDYRFWVLGLKPLDGPHAMIFAAYLVPWVMFFLVAIKALVSNLPLKGEGEVRQIVVAALAMAGGFAVMLVLQYASLFTTGLLFSPKEPLNVIIAIQFVPLLAVVGAIAIFSYRRTNSAVPGALICALMISWYISAGTATHYSKDFPMRVAARAK
jgi:pimeloyl-ACP methyl ester carboxylesterase